MTYPFKNLVFEGGGVKGIAYAGAMKVLEKKGILKNIVRVGGTSAGAINVGLPKGDKIAVSFGSPPHTINLCI